MAGPRERERIRPLEHPTNRRKKVQKNLENIWRLKLNLLPLHPLSKTIAQQQEEFFERFIDKQTSSTSPIHYILYDVIEKKQEPSINIY